MNSIISGIEIHASSSTHHLFLAISAIILGSHAELESYFPYLRKWFVQNPVTIATNPFVRFLQFVVMTKTSFFIYSLPSIQRAILELASSLRYGPLHNPVSSPSSPISGGAAAGNGVGGNFGTASSAASTVSSPSSVGIGLVGIGSSGGDIERKQLLADIQQSIIENRDAWSFEVAEKVILEEWKRLL